MLISALKALKQWNGPWPQMAASPVQLHFAISAIVGLDKILDPYRKNQFYF